MWPPSQWPLGWILIGIIIFMFFFFIFWPETTNISLFGHLPLDPECITQQYWPALLIFFWFFPYYTCFWSRDANVSISGNACWTLETVPSQHHHQSITIFFWFFLYFIAIFHPEKHCFLYLEVCTGPWKNTHPSWQLSLLSLFYRYFSFSIATLFIFGNVCWTLNTMPNMVTNHPPFFPLFFRIFFTILLLFFTQHSHTFHIWKCALDPENSAQHHHQQWAPLLSSLMHLEKFPFWRLQIAALAVNISAEAGEGEKITQNVF